MWHFIATDITKIKTITITIPLYTQLNMKIAIAQLYTRHFDEWAYISIKNKEAYCNKYGYDLVTRRGGYKTNFELRHPSWHSILLLLEILETTNVDWIFWSDIDALIMDQTVRLEKFIKPKFDMIIPNQGEGEYCDSYTKSCLCCGHYFIRNTEWSKKFLRLVWDWPKNEFYKYRMDNYWEQCAVNDLREKNAMDFDKHVYIEPKNRAFNSFYFQDPEEQPMEFTEWGESWFRTKLSKKAKESGLGSVYNTGDFIVHFAGAHCIPQRKKLMEKYSEKVKWN